MLNFCRILVILVNNALHVVINVSYKIASNSSRKSFVCMHDEKKLQRNGKLLHVYYQIDKDLQTEFESMPRKSDRLIIIRIECAFLLI